MDKKPTYEVAGDITVAWLSAMGALSQSASLANRAFEILSDPEKVAEFYRTIEKAVGV